MRSLSAKIASKICVIFAVCLCFSEVASGTKASSHFHHAIVILSGKQAKVVKKLRTTYFLSSQKSHLVAFIRWGNKNCWTSTKMAIRVGKRLCRPFPTNKGMIQVKWFLARPKALDYDNTKACGLRRLMKKTCVQHIKYSRQTLPIVYKRPSWHLASVPNWRKGGTYRIGLSYKFQGKWVHLPRTCCKQPQPTNQELLQLTTLVIRRNNGYVGYLSELLGVPFVFYPGWWHGQHQTDYRWGADCVALAIYGRRRMGHTIPYMAPPALIRYTKVVGKVQQGAKQPSRIRLIQAKVKVGDLLHFGFQTAVLSKDVAPIGYLTSADIVIHTYHRYATESTLAKLPYAHLSFVVRRWK